jgi:hypothetical protein
MAPPVWPKSYHASREADLTNVTIDLTKVTRPLASLSGLVAGHHGVAQLVALR